MEKRKLHKRFFAVVAVMLILCSIILTCMGTGVTAFADGKEDSSVMTDLFQDGTFNANDYPEKQGDYSLQVIQIAETKQGGLVVYVYQPGAKLLATHISISTDEKKLTPNMYALTKVSSYGVFFKYGVDGLAVKNQDTRCYEIISIYRKWNADYDKPAADGSGNTVNEVSYEVGQLWSADTAENGEVRYYCEKKDVITVTGKLCGFIRYNRAMIGGTTVASPMHELDAHFVAFATDKPIGELLEADIYYISEEVYKGFSQERWEEEHGRELGAFELWSASEVTDKEKEHKVTVDSAQEGSNCFEERVYTDKQNQQIKYFGYKLHTFDRIQTVEEFKNGEKLTGGTKEGLDGLSWVLRFVETPFNYPDMKDVDFLGYHWKSIFESWTTVKSVSIMRLKYRTEGRTYNLGVVDNMQTSSEKPSGGGGEFEERGLPWWIWIVIGIGAFIIAIIVLSLIFRAFGELLKTIFKAIGKALLWLICLPFKGIVALVRKIRGG